jgi:hypothetical protein
VRSSRATAFGVPGAGRLPTGFAATTTGSSGSAAGPAGALSPGAARALVVPPRPLRLVEVGERLGGFVEADPCCQGFGIALKLGDVQNLAAPQALDKGRDGLLRDLRADGVVLVRLARIEQDG